ncbi:ornithine carbamoyltransferase [uncultured Helicobacter sp.]|uniref:ornithine carbamoyltransferase n=1 Tax=uncultured Helicobacter sp. TaxID=175537 RepID=UPI0025881E99|nr:ornithine carbamoyltransferase [uncultured Helicobacter sp.]
MRHFLTLKDFSKQEIIDIMCLSFSIKADFLRDRESNTKYFRNKILGMIFEKPSTRTRVSFEAGAYQLGGQAIVLMGKDTQIGRGEPIKDTARVMSGMVDMIMMRTFEQEKLEEFATYSSVPIINGLTDLYHPVQVLADLMTIIECGFYTDDFKDCALEFKDCSQKKSSPIIAYVGDGNNIVHSWLYLAALLGLEFRIACPNGYSPDEVITQTALTLAKSSHAKISLTQDPNVAVKDCNIIITDTWISMGQEDQKQQKIAIFKEYCVDQALMAKASDDAIFLHCLPAYRGYEVSEEVFEGDKSKVWQEAHNRLHIQKGIMVWLQQNQ